MGEVLKQVQDDGVDVQDDAEVLKQVQDDGVEVQDDISKNVIPNLFRNLDDEVDL